MPLRPADEHPHPASGPDWSETWTFDLASADGSLGGWVSLTRFAGHAWYQAALVGPHRQLLAVLDHEVPFRSSPLEVRTTGLWADHVCETPFDHWTVGLEAFALGVDDPRELLGRQHGDQVALGFDLEWESAGPVLDLGPDGYEVPCTVHGEVLVGRDVIDLDGVGTRAHRWGRLDWAAEDGWHLAGVVEGGRRWSVDHRDGATTARDFGAGGDQHVSAPVADLVVDGDGLPVSATTDDLRAEVLAAVPVPLPVDGGEVCRTRALCRLRTRDGAVGVGWLEVRGATARLAPG
ncbi:MAG TPA: hypothetical protein VFV42_08715 [Acidimicrobiales bacterium]|nr:hypothetical protein [Acidimicrobiales bacterium]